MAIMLTRIINARLATGNVALAQTTILVWLVQRLATTSTSTRTSAMRTVQTAHIKTEMITARLVSLPASPVQDQKMVSVQLVCRCLEMILSSLMGQPAWQSAQLASFLRTMSVRDAQLAARLVRLQLTSAHLARGELICLELSVMPFAQWGTLQIKMRWYVRVVILAARAVRVLVTMIQSAQSAILNFTCTRVSASLIAQMAGRSIKQQITLAAVLSMIYQKTTTWPTRLS